MAITQQQTDTQGDPAVEVMSKGRPAAPWRVAGLETLPGFWLRVLFNDGIEGIVDIRAFTNSPGASVFAGLRDENQFQQARIVMGAVT